MSTASILMVDDNPVNLVVLRALLGKEGYELIAADSGQAALDLVRTNPKFDLILLDVSMPGIDGIAVCRSLKSDPLTAHIPIVLVSGVRTDEESITEGCNAGADGYLTKPIEDTAIRAWVRAALMVTDLYEKAAQQEGQRPCSAKEARELLRTLPCEAKGPVESIIANAEILAMELPSDSPFRQRLIEIQNLAVRVARHIAAASARTGEFQPAKRTRNS